MVILLTPPPYAGDCNGDGEVTVNEIITMVNAASGSADYLGLSRR
jgi:hypothetical protein